MAWFSVASRTSTLSWERVAGVRLLSEGWGRDRPSRCPPSPHLEGASGELRPCSGPGCARRAMQIGLYRHPGHACACRSGSASYPGHGRHEGHRFHVPGPTALPMPVSPVMVPGMLAQLGWAGVVGPLRWRPQSAVNSSGGSLGRGDEMSQRTFGHVAWVAPQAGTVRCQARLWASRLLPGIGPVADTPHRGKRVHGKP